MTAMRKPRASGSWLSVYGSPLAIGMLSLAGLLAALMFEGAGRYFSWIALGTPIAAAVWALFRRKRDRNRRMGRGLSQLTNTRKIASS